MNVRKATIAILLVSSLFMWPHEVAAPVVAVAETTPTTPHLPSAVIAAWSKVAWCETHADWHRDMPTFDGGLGISRVVWNEVGGTDYAPAPHLASIEDQIRVAQRIQTRGGVAGYVPDQNGCSGAW